jgi:hypothetical protein
MGNYITSREKIMISTLHSSRKSILYIFTRRLGVSLLAAMPLVSLTNIWEVATIGGLSIRGIDLLFLLTLVVWVYHILSFGKVRRGVPLFFGLISTFFLISLFGSIALSDYQVQWYAMLRFTQTLLWGGLALSFVRNSRDLEIITRNIVIAGTILAVFSIYLYLTDSGWHRIAGFFSVAGGEGFGAQASFNEIGALYALAALLSICYLLWFGKSFQRWRLLIGIDFFLNVIGLIFVQSRSAIIAFFIGLVALLILPKLKNLFIYGKVSRCLITYSITILIVGVIIVISSTYLVEVDRLTRTFLPGSSEYISAVTRLSLWNRASQVWLSKTPYFLLGYGFRSSFRFIGAESAHNFFLNIGLWLGLAGLIPILVLLIWPLIKLSSKIKCPYSNVVVATFSVALVVSMFGNVLVDPFYGGCTFLILYGALAASHPLKTRRS